MSPRPYDVATNPSPQPLEIEVFICSMKQCSGELPTATDVANLFQLNATATAPSGQLTDLTQDVNTDVFHCYKRLKFKLGYSSSSGTGANAGNQSFNNNDFKLNIIRSLNLMKYCPKTVTYNDSAVTPTSRCLFAMINVVPSVGGTAFSSAVFPCRLDSTISINYEDA